MAKRTSESFGLYTDFVEAYRQAQSAQSKQITLQNAQAEWNALKHDKEALLKRKEELQHNALVKKNKRDAFFLKLTAQKPSAASSAGNYH